MFLKKIVFFSIASAPQAHMQRDRAGDNDHSEYYTTEFVHGFFYFKITAQT